MPRGSRPGEYRGGRAEGTPNKATLRKREQKRLADEVAEKIGATPEIVAQVQQATEEIQLVRTALRAKDKLIELAGVVESHVGQFQRAAIGERGEGLPGQSKFSAPMWDRLQSWVALYQKILDSAADFQDPRLKATAVLSAPPPPVDVVPAPDKIARLGNAVAASRAYQQLMQAPRQLALPPAAKRSA